MTNLLPLLIGAGTVGVAHMAAPDHWLTLALLGRSKQWNRSRIFRTSLVASIGHVLISIALGVGVAAIGIFFSTLISDYIDIAIGIVMVVIGLIIGIKPLVKKGQAHHMHEHEHGMLHLPSGKSDKSKLSENVGYIAVLGAALSPDPSIAPIFLAAVPGGFDFLVELAILFAITSIATLIFLVELGHRGFTKALERIPEKYNDSIVGFVIAAVGAFILIEAH